MVEGKRVGGGGKGEVSLQLNIISGPAWSDNNPPEVKGEDKDALHHSETHGRSASSASLASPGVRKAHLQEHRDTSRRLPSLAL